VEEVKWVSMLQCSVLLESFPKLVRDLRRDCGKDADLVVVGGGIEAEIRVVGTAETGEEALEALPSTCRLEETSKPRLRIT